MAKPWKIPYLNPREKLGVCLERILRTRCREIFSYEQETIKGTNIEALHDMRVATRRLQSAMKVFRNCFPQKQITYHYKRVRWLLRLLGQVRDHDVFIDTLDNYKQSLDPHDRPAIELMIARWKNLRLEERKNLLKELKSMKKENYKRKFLQFCSTAR